MFNFEKILIIDNKKDIVYFWLRPFHVKTFIISPPPHLQVVIIQLDWVPVFQSLNVAVFIWCLLSWIHTKQWRRHKDRWGQLQIWNMTKLKSYVQFCRNAWSTRYAWNAWWARRTGTCWQSRLLRTAWCRWIWWKRWYLSWQLSVISAGTSSKRNTR